MNTQAIPGPVNILAPTPASGSSTAPADTAEVSFNQVLQREVTERRSAEQPAKPQSNQPAEKSPRQEPAAQATAGTGKSDAVAAKNKDEAEPTDESEQLSDAANASAELIALVASMAQINSPVADAKPAGADAAYAAQLNPDAALGKGKTAASNADELAAKTPHADSLRATSNLPGAAADFAQTAKDMPKDSRNAVPAQQFSMAQLGASQAGAVSVDSLAAETAGLAPEAGTTTSVSMLAPMQQALNKVHAATTQAADSLAPPVGTPAWDQSVGQKVVWMVAGSQQSASLTLNPPDLGPLQIVLNVNNSQANATFVAAQPEVRQALEAALPKLREMLGDAGIQLGQTNINAGTPQHGGRSEQEKSSSPQFANDRNSEPSATPARQQVIRQGLGMVDTFA